MKINKNEPKHNKKQKEPNIKLLKNIPKIRTRGNMEIRISKESARTFAPPG